MGRAPSFQFYPADWLNDIKLQSCCMATQGIIINLMCIMHQSEKYGYLMINGTKPDHKTIIKLLRTHHRTFLKAISEIRLYNVLCEDEDGVLYCKRMVKDQALREVRKACGKLGGNPNLLNQKVNQTSNQNPTPSSSSSTSSSSSKPKKKINKRTKTLIPDIFPITESMREWFESQNFKNIAIEPATEQFKDYWKSEGKLKADWLATWRNGMKLAEKWASNGEDDKSWQI